MLPFNTTRSILWHLIFYAIDSNRKIASLNHCSHPLVGKLRKKLVQLKLSWEHIDTLSDTELKTKFYPKLTHRKSDKIQPDVDEVIKQNQLPKKQRKSIAIQFLSYRLTYGVKGYKKSRFYQLINQQLANNNCIMKQQYLAGEIMFIDYLGTKAKCMNGNTTIQFPVFVACLGYSKKLFVFATQDMKTHSWILGIIKAFEYFGGVPEVVLSDNAKAMITKPQLIALLNDNLRALSQYYSCIFTTSRVGTPKDNANAENGAKISTSQIVAPMNQDLTFFSLDEVNTYLQSEVDCINSKPFQKQKYSRNDLFDCYEQKALAPLPLSPYVPFIATKTVIVPATYHIVYEGHEYSVPYTLVSKKVLIHITAQEVIVFYEHQEVAKHKLSNERGGFTRLTAHMKPSHQAEARKTKPVFMAWAKGIGLDAETLINKQYSKTNNVHSRAIGKRCIALQKLHKKYGQERFLKACHYVVERNAEDFFDPTDIELVIRAKAYEEDSIPLAITHTNVRGSQYFEGEHHEH
jgi:hypothetical protein